MQKRVYVRFSSVIVLFAIMLGLSCSKQPSAVPDMFNHAQSRSDDLRFSIYITAHAVQDLLSSEAGRREALSIFRANGATKAYVEFYRSGLVVEEQILEDAKNFFERNHIAVVGGIATVPGKDFGVRQQGRLGWFNWQNQKTQDDLKKVMRMAAGVFDEIIVDDFLCTADTSDESKHARGDRSWSQYRRDLLTQLSQEIFIETAREVNPDISIIIKYPQWYDRFHLFGYDVTREPALYDKVWVGTETRGQYTQRYGFVQPYEGFVNYRWLATLSDGKISGAWFDHGDCDGNDFIEQAYQTVLAGAKEIVFFNYYPFVNGHPGHHLLRMQFDQLADLAREVARDPVVGIDAYKPANSDAGGDLYLMDFIGMLGVSLVPHSEYPAQGDVIFLPTQAATDSAILEKVMHSLENKATLIFTTGFLSAAKDGEQLASLAGVQWPVVSTPFTSHKLIADGQTIDFEKGLDLESNCTLTSAQSLFEVQHGFEKIPFLAVNETDEGTIYTLNVHTFSQADFDRVGEVLLCPKPLGLVELPQIWAETLRAIFNEPLGIELSAPTRIALQQLGRQGFVVHNYNKSNKQITLKIDEHAGTWQNGFTGEVLEIENGVLETELPARSRMWIKKLESGQ